MHAGLVPSVENGSGAAPGVGSGVRILIFTHCGEIWADPRSGDLTP